jgi:hypothetical protein
MDCEKISETLRIADGTLRGVFKSCIRKTLKIAFKSMNKQTLIPRWSLLSLVINMCDDFLFGIEKTNYSLRYLIYLKIGFYELA